MNFEEINFFTSGSIEPPLKKTGPIEPASNLICGPIGPSEFNGPIEPVKKSA